MIAVSMPLGSGNGQADRRPLRPFSPAAEPGFRGGGGRQENPEHHPVPQAVKGMVCADPSRSGLPHSDLRCGVEGGLRNLLVNPSLWPELVSESTFSPRALITAVNRQGVLFIWPIRLPGSDGRLDEWSRSAMEAATLAAGKWVRVQANMSLGAYEVYEAAGQWAAPEWPDMPFQQLPEDLPSRTASSLALTIPS